MAALTELLASGGIFRFILVLMLIEAAVLIAYRARTGSGIATVDLLASLLAGMGLLLAAIATLTHGSPALIGLFLAIALISHVLDLRRRWRPGSGSAT